MWFSVLYNYDLCFKIDMQNIATTNIQPLNITAFR